MIKKLIKRYKIKGYAIDHNQTIVKFDSAGSRYLPGKVYGILLPRLTANVKVATVQGLIDHSIL
jgi:hypothetical protein